MEDIIIAYKKQLETLRRHVRAQTEALGILQKAFAQEAENRHRQEEALRLDALRARVIQEIDHLQMMETVSSSGFTEGRLIGGGLSFALGSLGAIIHDREHPFAIGAKLADGELKRTAPFGKVMVAIGPAGIPDDVRVISVSQHAREQGKSEPEIIAAIEGQGCYLVIPEDFPKMLDWLKKSVIEGSLSLPFTRSLSLTRHSPGLQRLKPFGQ